MEAETWKQIRDSSLHSAEELSPAEPCEHFESRLLNDAAHRARERDGFSTNMIQFSLPLI